MWMLYGMLLKLAAHWISVNKALHAMHWIVIVGVHIHPFNSGSLLDGIVQSDYSVCIYSHSRDGNQSLRQNKIQIAKNLKLNLLITVKPPLSSHLKEIVR